MADQIVGNYNFKIKSYESDKQGFLSISSLFLYLQECAWENAMDNGFGYEFMEKENSFWVLSRVKINMENWPVWKDEIAIKTWPRGPQGLFAIRDFEVTGSKGNIAKVSSSWLILDKETRRPRKLSDFDFAKSDFSGEKAIEGEIEKISIPDNMLLIHQRIVFSSDIDVNGHVNNATYVRWISDAFNAIFEAKFQSFTINFLSELMLDSNFGVWYGWDEKRIVFLLKDETGKEICRAKID